MNRKGMAVLVVLITLLLVTGLATAVLTAARLRQVSGARQLAARRALEAATGWAARHAAEWDPAAAAGLMPGGGRWLPIAGRGPPSLEIHDTLVRLGASLYLIRSVVLVKTGDGSTLAREGVAQLVEVMPPAAAGAIAPSRAVMAGSMLDDVEIVPPVRPTVRGWWRWP